MSRTHLEPILRPGLDVVFVGMGPKTNGVSLRTGHYYADPTNSFWSSLWESGWSARLLRPTDDAGLPGMGIGLDDVYLDPIGLRKRVEAAAPRAVCFNSKEAIALVCGVSPSDLPPWRGKLAEGLVAFLGVSIVWAVPDGSGRAARYPPDRITLLCELRRRLGRDSLRATGCGDR